MTYDTHHFFHDVVRGSRRGPTAAALRLALASVEPFYAGVTSLRNYLYIAGLLSATCLLRAVIGASAI